MAIGLTLIRGATRSAATRLLPATDNGPGPPQAHICCRVWRSAVPAGRRLPKCITLQMVEQGGQPVHTPTCWSSPLEPQGPTHDTVTSGQTCRCRDQAASETPRTISSTPEDRFQAGKPPWLKRLMCVRLSSCFKQATRVCTHTRTASPVTTTCTATPPPRCYNKILTHPLRHPTTHHRSQSPPHRRPQTGARAPHMPQAPTPLPPARTVCLL